MRKDVCSDIVPSANAACTLLFNVWVLAADPDPGPVAADGGFVRLIYIDLRVGNSSSKLNGRQASKYAASLTRKRRGYRDEVATAPISQLIGGG